MNRIPPLLCQLDRQRLHPALNPNPAFENSRLMLELLKAPKAGFALDLDSTVFLREVRQEGQRRVAIPGDLDVQATIRFWL